MDWIAARIVESFDPETDRSIIYRFRVGLILGPWLDGEVGRWTSGNFELTDGRFTHVENVIELEEVWYVNYAAVITG